MKELEKQIFKILKEIEEMIESGENKDICQKRKELDDLLEEYLKDFK